MKRKLIKYTKFIISVALIAGLIAPSYAALSASDGSAFVTKAEFDSALADFNARLTTFEAGINSKIDSQVTSYLDRNGIWSGKVQVIIPGSENGGGVYSFTSSATLKNGGAVGVLNGQPTVAVWWAAYYNITFPTLRPDHNIVVHEISKSGLCHVLYDLTGSNGVYIRFLMGVVDGAVFPCNSQLIVQRGCRIFEKAKNTETYVSKYENIETLLQTAYGRIQFFDVSNVSAYFFVTSGSALAIDNYINVSESGITAYDKSRTASTGINVKEISIY